ncbi:type II secretion system protein N [Sphingosinicella sp. BN140058]|uniref:type II secretion system protein N n=1 Tax=Sphingosinicella sp. BN140058 TaxID=1892855 RepID=UPI00101320AF|nr:type II secretion system protein N [Sphingosinicella sp. BN140058]QAY78541.1 hypothetical protein ETR14_19845 [Sphingosinicella sp. BN140058]
MSAGFPVKQAAWFGLALLLSLGATVPMKVAASHVAGAVTARGAEGSIWRGRLVDLGIGGLRLGSPDAVALPVSLPGGEPILSLKWSGAGSLRGRAAFSTRGASVRGLTGTVDLVGSGPLPRTALALHDFSFAARDGRCAMARGRVKAALSDLPLPVLEGTPRCVGDRLLLPLTGDGRTLTLRFDGVRATAELRGPGGVILPERGL